MFIKRTMQTENKYKHLFFSFPKDNVQPSHSTCLTSRWEYLKYKIIHT